MSLNVMTVGVTLFALALAVLVPALMVGAYRRFKGTRVATCPETGQPAVVEVDARLAAASAVFGEPCMRLKTCSRWPELGGCDQDCRDQIQAAPEELLARWCAGKTCALCGGPVGMSGPRGLCAALMDCSGRTIEWRKFLPENLPRVLATHQPVCRACHRRHVAPRSLP